MEGRKEGRKEGKKEGRNEGREEGREEGRNEGRKEGTCLFDNTTIGIIYTAQRIVSHRNDKLKLGFHISGKRKRHAAAACGCGMRYAYGLIPYIRLPMRLHSLFLSE